MKLKWETFVNRFWQRVAKRANGCWEWTGKLNNYGYGKCQFNRRELSVHRVAYELRFGAIPSGLVIDHLCRNRKCANPEHMELVTNVENVMRGQSPYAQKKRQTHCIRGHLLDGSNVKIRKNGTRYCMACERERVASGYYRERYKRNAHSITLVR